MRWLFLFRDSPKKQKADFSWRKNSLLNLL